MELTLDNRLEIGLHGFSGNINHICDAVLASQLHLVHIRSHDGDLVILYLGSVFGLYQLGAVHTGSVELYLHVTTADNLTFKSGSKCHRDIDLGNFDLNVACLQGSSIELAYILLHNQALGYAEDILGLVGDYREAQSDSAGSAGNDHIIQRREGIDECRYTLHGVLHQSFGIARCDISKNQSSSQSYGYHMDYRGYILAQGDYTHIGSGVHAGLSHLIADTAYQSYQDTLCLIGFYQIHAFLYGGSGTQDNSYARDVSGYQRHTQLTDYSVRQMAVQRLLIGSRAVDIFQNLNELRAQSSGNTGHKRVV